ncbi:MAG: hypothetical protein ACLQBB_08185 [Solirubrobacteraceae bacterium]
MSERPADESPLLVIEALGAAFRSLGEPPRGRRPLTRRALLIALALVLLLAGAATAAILITKGAPLPAANSRDLQSQGVPLAATARLAGLDAPDPRAGEPAWDIRLSRTAAGETCTAVGQVLGSQFGIVGLDHVFRALALGGVDACGVAAPDGPLLAGARVFVGADPAEARTVVNGVAGPGVRSVTVYGPGGPRPLRLGPQGSFITVYAGYVEEVRPRIVLAMSDGRSRSIALSPSYAFEVADPTSRYAWQVSGGADLGPGAFPDENCAQAGEMVGRNDPSQFEASLTPIVCGRLGNAPLFVSIRRFVPGTGERTGFPWGNTPSRTLVYGAAAPRVAALTLLGAGPPRPLAIDPHGGVFLAVLDGHVDPRLLSLQARLRDGRTIAFRRSTPLYDERSNKPIAPAPVPAYREPLPRAQAEPTPAQVPISATIRETLRAVDPAGGPEWVLRSWQGRRNPRANFGAGYRPNRFYCYQVGILEHGHLVQPRPGRPSHVLSLGEQGFGVGGCDDPGSMERFPPLAEATTYLQDPYAYAPRPVRTVVSGMLRPDATDPVLTGAGPPRPLRLDRNRAFLLVLPGRYWDAELHVSAIVKGRRIGGSGNTLPVPYYLTVPQARAPDPDGGAPWGFAADANGSAYGRIVEGRVAVVEPLTGTLHTGPDGSTGGGNERRPRRRPPVLFDAQGGPEPDLPGGEPATPSPPEIERRALPGRTIITGIAQPDVVSVTIATPSDVRTVRPSGPDHVLIVVYDGQFFRGRITATVRLRNGRTVVEQIPNGPGGAPGPPQGPPSLAARLRSDENTLAGMESQVAAARHASPSERTKLLHGGSFAMIVEGLRQIRGDVAAERARLAYEAAHPGQLPPE